MFGDCCSLLMLIVLDTVVVCIFALHRVLLYLLLWFVIVGLVIEFAFCLWLLPFSGCFWVWVLLLVWLVCLVVV